MSTQRGIFETFPNQTPPSSPFAVVPESPRTAAPSPFAVASPPQSKKESPFAVVDEGGSQDDLKTIRLPERRKASDTPFHISEPQGFGFEAAPQALKATLLEPAQQAPAPQQAAPPSPFTMGQPSAAPQPPAHSPFGGWPQAVVSPVHAPVAGQPPAPTPAPTPAFTPQSSPPGGESSTSDSYSIKQLELRAIFGVDREMSREEIVQRSRSLPGIRQIALVSESDIAAVDALKQVIFNLGFGSSPIKLYSGSVPIEFIREGKTLLAVQTDGGFAPGVRETLMLVARELSR
jgi:hypothetical protein